MAMKLFCPENPSIRKFEAIEYETDSNAKVRNKIFFIDAVTVGKCVSVQKDVPQHSVATYRGKDI